MSALWERIKHRFGKHTPTGRVSGIRNEEGLFVLRECKYCPGWTERAEGS